MSDISTLVAQLKTLPLPVAHTVFLKPQKPPYLIYLDESVDITAANSKGVQTRTEVQLELYTEIGKTSTAEEIVEALLDDLTTYEKARTYIADERVYVTYYTFDI